MTESQSRYVPQKITKLLVANRGEIAVRVMRTCKELGIKTVAIYSEADRGALHVRTADEAYCVGEAPSRDSYLKINKIIDVAIHSKVQAIHPGYGFLSENATFAEACAAAGLIFVGPSPESIRSMGDKTTARLMMEKAGVPMAPGTPDAIDDPEEAARIAEEIGYPVLIKAAAGGGGKGMRLVEDPSARFCPRSRWRSERLNLLLEMEGYLLKNTSLSPVILSFRFFEITLGWGFICLNENAPFSDVIRKS